MSNRNTCLCPHCGGELLAVIVAPEQIIRLAAELASMQPEESPQAWHGKLLDLLQDDAAKAKPSDD